MTVIINYVINDNERNNGDDIAVTVVTTLGVDEE